MKNVWRANCVWPQTLHVYSNILRLTLKSRSFARSIREGNVLKLARFHATFLTRKSNIAKCGPALSEVSRISKIWVGVRESKCRSNRCQCVCEDACARVWETVGEASGRPVSYSTPSCGRVGVELSISQVNRPYTPPHLWGHYSTSHFSSTFLDTFKIKNQEVVFLFFASGMPRFHIHNHKKIILFWRSSLTLKYKTFGRFVTV